MNHAPNVSDEKRTAVLNAARELGYRPNLHARNLAQQRTRTLGILVNDIQNPFFAEVVAGVEEASAGHDYDVIILNGGRDRERERRALETFLQFQVEAVILIGSRQDPHELARIAQLVPTVVVAASGAPTVTDTIATDEPAATQLAVDHLVELGHTNIVHIDGGDNVSAMSRRLGFDQAMTAHGLQPRTVRGGAHGTDAESAVRALLSGDHQPTAILAFNDLVAAGTVDALGSAGLTVPHDVSVVSIDNTFLAALAHLSLTAVNQPRRRMGQLAFATALDRLHERDTIRNHRDDLVPDPPKQLTLTPRLVVRRSSGPPRVTTSGTNQAPTATDQPPQPPAHQPN